MAIKVRELHHHAIRVPPASARAVQQFYSEVLGLEADPGRPNIPGVPGAWMYVGAQGRPTAQIHIMGTDGMPPFAKSAQQDPTRFHVALAVDDIQETQAELERTKTPYWVSSGVLGPQSIQIFLEDPAGNMIELHQIGTCRCNKIALKS